VNGHSHCGNGRVDRMDFSDVTDRPRRAVLAAAGVALTGVVTGCSDGSGSDASGGSSESGGSSDSGDRDAGSPSGGSPDGELTPTETSTASLEPSDVPTRWRTVEGEGFTIGVPGSFREDTKKASNGTTMYLFDAPGASGKASDPARVAVVRDVKPTAGVMSLSQVLVESKAVENEKPPVRSQLTWPGVDKPALLVQWMSPIRGGHGGTQETWQLMVQVDPDLIINVLAVAPEGTLEKKKLVQVMSTFKVA